MDKKILIYDAADLLTRFTYVVYVRCRVEPPGHQMNVNHV